MRNMKSKLLITSGSILILCALLLSGYHIYTDANAKVTTSKVNQEIKHVLENNTNEYKDIYQEIPLMEMPTVEINDHLYIGTLNIPKLNLSLPIMNTCNSNHLKIAPCRYYGSIYTNDMVIAAHNYRSHFSRIHELKENDQVIFKDIDGHQFIYQVVCMEILENDDVEKMIHHDYDLTLFTCTVGGVNRITVRLERIYE